MITYAKALISLCMFALLYREAPAIEHSTKKYHVQHREDVVALGNIFYDTGSKGSLVNPDVDPLILAAMAFEESRYRQHGPDGDPSFKGGHKICTKPGPCYGPRTPVVRIGQSIGPMQISRGAPYWVKKWDANGMKEGKLWAGLTLTQLRDPAINVAFAYTLLGMFKNKCGGSPGVWIDSYGRGKCSSKNRIGRKAKIRCKHVDSFIKKMSENYAGFEAPENFTCMSWEPPPKKEAAD
jgi:hypothetical protein